MTYKTKGLAMEEISKLYAIVIESTNQIDQIKQSKCVNKSVLSKAQAADKAMSELASEIVEQAMNDQFIEQRQRVSIL